MDGIEVWYIYPDESKGGARTPEEITDIVTTLSIRTSIGAQPGTMNFSVIKEDYEIILGAGVKVIAGGKDVFEGFIFSVTSTKAKVWQIVAYDALRYLKNQDTFVLGKYTASDIVRKVCRELELETGTIDAAGYVIPAKVEENKSGFDVIKEAMDQELVHNKRQFIIQAEGLKISFRDIENLRSDIIIDEANGEIDFEHNANIDKQTFSAVKVITKGSKGKGKKGADHWYRYPKPGESSPETNQFGYLVYSHIFDESVTEGQLEELANKVLDIYGRPQQTLSLTCFGNWDVKAGTGVHVRFSTFKSFDSGQGYYVKECEHKITNAKHEMVLELCAQYIDL